MTKQLRKGNTVVAVASAVNRKLIDKFQKIVQEQGIELDGGKVIYHLPESFVEERAIRKGHVYTISKVHPESCGCGGDRYEFEETAEGVSFCDKAFIPSAEVAVVLERINKKITSHDFTI